MGTEDIQNFRGRLKRQRELLEESEAVAPADREAIQRFLRTKQGSIAVSSMEVYLRRLRHAAEYVSTPLTDLERDAFEQLLYQIATDPEMNHGDGTLSTSTVRSFENVLCLFFDEELEAEWASDIERTSVDRSPVNAEDMLLPEDIEALLDSTRHQRDAALIEFLADTGARLTLTASLRVKDVSLDGDVATYQPNSNAIGLKGAEIQPYPIIDARAAMRTYLATSHPRPNEPEAAFFHKIERFGDSVDEDDGSLRANALHQHLRRLGDRSDCEKPVNPHNFKHSAVTRMYREGFDKQQIQHRVHWTIDTDMWERYVHITAEEMNEEIFADAGVVDASDGSSVERRHCGNCTETLAPHHRFCPTCGDAVDPGERDVVETVAQDGIEDLADGDLSPTEREAVAAALRVIRDDNSQVDGHE